jgi:uncharacterized SAM-binding protein YcdF (DUF218 family)
MLLISMNVGAWVLSRPLELWYKPDPFPSESAEAIVILAGAMRSPTENQPYTIPAQSTYERLQHGVWLYKHWKPIPILVCGGSLDGREPHALTMKRTLELWGVPAQSIWIESISRSTHEHALYGARLLSAHGVSRIALVAEASSMPRAAASFRKAGITVIPAPIRFTRFDWGLRDMFPNWRAIASNGETLHELLGLAWYRMRGWI